MREIEYKIDAILISNYSAYVEVKGFENEIKKTETQLTLPEQMSNAIKLMVYEHVKKTLEEPVKQTFENPVPLLTQVSNVEDDDEIPF